MGAILSIWRLRACLGSQINELLKVSVIMMVSVSVRVRARALFTVISVMVFMVMFMDNNDLSASRVGRIHSWPRKTRGPFHCCRDIQEPVGFLRGWKMGVFNYSW